MPRTSVRQRDIFDWIGVVVNLGQALLFIAAALGALLWFAQTGGLPTIAVAIGVVAIILLACEIVRLVR